MLSPSEADDPASIPSNLPAPRLFHTCRAWACRPRVVSGCLRLVCFGLVVMGCTHFSDGRPLSIDFVLCWAFYPTYLVSLACCAGILCVLCCCVVSGCVVLCWCVVLVSCAGVLCWYLLCFAVVFLQFYFCLVLLVQCSRIFVSCCVCVAGVSQ